MRNVVECGTCFVRECFWKTDKPGIEKHAEINRFLLHLPMDIDNYE